jgi:hypothetical protein
MHFSGPEGSNSTRELGIGRSYNATSNVQKDLHTVSKNFILHEKKCYVEDDTILTRINTRKHECTMHLGWAVCGCGFESNAVIFNPIST